MSESQKDERKPQPYFFLTGLILVCVLIAMMVYTALTYWPIEKAMMRSFEKSHMSYISDISRIVKVEKTLAVSIERLHFPDSTPEGEGIDSSTNTLFHTFYRRQWIIPAVFYVTKRSKLYTKYCISQKGDVVVYSYYYPKTEKNILVTKTRKPVYALGDLAYNAKESWDQCYMTEKEFLPILKEFGKDRL